MQVYQTDYQGFYVGPTMADPDPRDHGNWLIPAGCVTLPPPSFGDNQSAQWVSGSWVVVNDAAPTEPEPIPEPAITIEIQKAARRAAYTSESDPIFFASQRGEATVEEWQAKVAEIKARFPYPAA